MSVGKEEHTNEAETNVGYEWKLDSKFDGIEDQYIGIDENLEEELAMLEMADEGIITREELEMWYV